MKLRVPCPLLMCVVFAIKSFGDTRTVHYVTQDGGGVSDGSSEENAWPLSALNVSGNWGSGETKISAGETVYLLAGTYTSTVRLAGSGVEGSPVRLEPFGGEVIVRPEASAGLLFDGASWVTVDGGDAANISIEDAPSHGVYHGGVAQGIRLENLSVLRSGSDANTYGVRYHTVSNGNAIVGCTIWSNVADGVNWGARTHGEFGANVIRDSSIRYNGDDAITVAGSTDISDCLIGDFVDLGVVGDPHGDGVTHNNGSHVRVWNCRIQNMPNSCMSFFSSNGHIGDYAIYNNYLTSDQESGSVRGIEFAAYATADCTVSNILVANNVLADFDSVGLIVDDDSDGVMTQAGNVRILNNIFLNCYSPASTAFGVAGTGGAYTTNEVVIAHNVVMPGADGTARLGWNGVGYTNAAAFNAASGNVGNTNEDVAFVDYQTRSVWDLRLDVTDTVARDGGVPVADFATDYYGTSRPRGAGWDIGAHEFGALRTAPDDPPLRLWLGVPQ